MTNPATAMNNSAPRAYGSRKLELARRHRHANVGYMRDKDTFIKALLAEARARATATPRDVQLRRGLL